MKKLIVVIVCMLILQAVVACSSNPVSFKDASARQLDPETPLDSLETPIDTLPIIIDPPIYPQGTLEEYENMK